MRKTGKKLEKVVKLIQETFKDSPETNIYSNYKIPNVVGRKREIDVLIVSSINSFEIKIAIECKDYKTPVSVEKIEAFHSKCLRIPGISKMVFVTSNGYQKDAIEAAKHFEIELYQVQDISPETIQTWFSLKQIVPHLLLYLSQINVVGEEKEIQENLENDNERLVYFYEDKEPVKLLTLIWDILKEHKNEIDSALMLQFLKRKPEEPINKKTDFPIKIQLTGVYIIGLNGKQYDLAGIEATIKGWFEEKDVNILETKSYIDSNGESKANVLSAQFSNNQKVEIVLAEKDKHSFFLTNEKGESLKLKPLATYDPKTDKLDIH